MHSLFHAVNVVPIRGHKLDLYRHKSIRSPYLCISRPINHATHETSVALAVDQKL